MKKLLLLLFLLVTLQSYTQNFRFALISDLHIRANDSLAVNDLKKSVNHINTLPDVAFAIVSGDISEEGDRASLERAKEILDNLKVKYYIVSGNHETKWSESGATDFAKVYGSERFDFDYDGVKFLGFNTGPIIRMMDGHVAPQDIDWLKETLSKEPQNKPVILVTHYPLLPTDVDNWYEVTDAVRPFNIKAILGGHYHSSRLVNYDGIPAFINRSSLRDKADKVGGYTIFTITNDSITADVQKTNQAAKRLGGYSMKETYYTKDNSAYTRPDFSVNDQYPQVKDVWRARLGKTIYASPYVGDGRIYIGDDVGVMSCFDLKNGNLLWDFTSGNRIVGTACEGDGILVFGSSDDYIYALNSRNGKLRWKYKTNAPVLGSAAISHGVVYIGASDNTFRALDLKTGKQKWEYTGVKGYIETRPLIDNNKVIFGAWDNNMYALDKNTGKELWKWSGGRKGLHFSPAAVWPVSAHDKIFITAPDRVMSAVNVENGETVWRTAESMVRETIGLSEDKNRVYSKTMQDSVVCYSALGNEPKRLWITNVGYGYDHAASMPVEKDGVVFGSTKNGIVFALDGQTGKLLWKHKVGNSLVGTVWPVNARECVYCGGDGIVGLLRNDN